MRKVKIPTSMNPFVVHVNGEKYVYPAGTEQEVTDAVANVIDAYIKKENQQPDPTESPFSTSWNDLKDKPFGETTVKGDTLTWDGNTEGLINVTAGDVSYYRLSDAVVTSADADEGYTMVVSMGGQTEEFSGEAEISDGVLQFGGVIGCIPEDNFFAFGEILFEKKGFYVSSAVAEAINGGTLSLTIHGYNGFETTTIQTIETKYLPPLVSPSGKKFKLSVDDSGVLSATEV